VSPSLSGEIPQVRHAVFGISGENFRDFLLYGIAAMFLKVLGFATLIRAGTASMFLSVHRPRNGG